MTVKEAGADLVAGAKPAGDKDQQLTIKVLRGFMRDGVPVEIGSEVTLPIRFARALIAMNKAELLAAAEAEPEPGPEDDEDQPKRRGRSPKTKE